MPDHFVGLHKIKNSLPAGAYYFLGNQAVAEGAIAAGCRYFAGYPITPSTEILERLSERLTEVGGVFIQMEDEIASICSVIGASWAGAKAMTATSGPGFSLMQEGIGFAALTETPVVIVNMQRPGPSTGQGTELASGDIMQAKWGSHGDYQVIAISPWSVQEMYDQTINAFNLAERYRVPVILLGDTGVALARERVEVKEELTLFNRIKEQGTAFLGISNDKIAPMPAFGEGKAVKVTASHRAYFYPGEGTDSQVHEKLVLRVNNKITKNKEEIIEYEVYHIENADIVVVSYGFTARSSLYAVERLREEGQRVGMLRLKTLWPFPDQLMRTVGSRVKKVFIPEMNLGQVAGEVMKYASCDVIPYSQVDAEIIHPNTIIKELRKVL